MPHNDNLTLLSQSHGQFSKNEPGSEDDEDSDIVPAFSCRDRKIELHTHAKASHLLYHLGSKALTGDHRDSMRLTSIAASRWKAFMKPKVKAALTVAQSLKAVGQDVRI